MCKVYGMACSVCINKALLALDHVHSLTFQRWLLLPYSCRVGSSRQITCGKWSPRCLLSRPLQKVRWPCICILSCICNCLLTLLYRVSLEYTTIYISIAYRNVAVSQRGVIPKSSAVKILLHVFWETNTGSISVGYRPRRGIDLTIVGCFLFFHCFFLFLFFDGLIWQVYFNLEVLLTLLGSKAWWYFHGLKLWNQAYFQKKYFILQNRG